MPIYEYRCQSCGHEMEKLQKLSDPPLSDCPECQRPELRKLVSAAGFRLKGGGWYETDFKKDGKRNLAGDASESKSSKPESDKGKEKEKGKDKDSTSTGSKSDSAAGAGKAA